MEDTLLSNIYIDESGSMTHETQIKNNKYFIMALVLVEQPEKLKKIHKRFVQKYSAELKQMDDDNKMFDGKNFIELKGSAFTPIMKRNFVNFFCKNNYFRILYIQVDNSNVTKNLYRNKARAFNYILKLAVEYLSNRGILTGRNWVFNIDERNVKTDAKYNLQEILCTEFSTGKDIVDEINVKYFNSANNRIIQLADVFSNIFYSNIVTDGAYNDEIKYMAENKYLINTFIFPPHE